MPPLFRVIDADGRTVEVRGLAGQRRADHRSRVCPCRGVSCCGSHYPLPRRCGDVTFSRFVTPLRVWDSYVWFEGALPLTVQLVWGARSCVIKGQEGFGGLKKQKAQERGVSVSSPSGLQCRAALPDQSAGAPRQKTCLWAQGCSNRRSQKQEGEHETVNKQGFTQSARASSPLFKSERTSTLSGARTKGS